MADVAAAVIDEDTRHFPSFQSAHLNASEFKISAPVVLNVGGVNRALESPTV